jgi:hypothetical protein
MGRQNQLATRQRKQCDSYLDAFAGAYTGIIPVSILPSSSTTEASGMLSPAPYDYPLAVFNTSTQIDIINPLTLSFTKIPLPVPFSFISRPKL